MYRTISKTERHPTKWKKIFVNYVFNKGLMLKYTKPHITQYQRKKTKLQFKNWVVDLNKASSKDTVITDWHMKILNINNYLETANQNHNEISPHICHNGYHQEDRKAKMLARIWRKRNTHALLIEMWIGVATVENSMEVPQKAKIRAILQSSNSTPSVIYPMNMKHACQKIHAPQCSKLHYS